MVKNILIIILISVFLAVVYNFVNPKALLWFPKAEEVVSDSLLNANTGLDSNTGEEFPSVSYKQVVERLNNPDFVIIDARNAQEFGESNIPGSINMDPYGNEEEFMQKLFEEIPRDKKYIIYCHGGKCDLSHMVAEKMKQFDFKNIYIFTGGWEVWTKEKGIK